MSDYAYQAFLSYKRHPLTDHWHQQLHQRIQYWLSQDLAASTANVFFDSRSIDNGLDFNSFITEALRGSAVLICIFSPLYFTSAHCLSEINAFFDREQMLKLRRGSLIACARFHDGERYPANYRTMQAYDFTKFANTAKRFWETEKGVEFEEIIQQFSAQVADKIKIAPAPSADFPSSFFNENASVFAEKIRRPADYLKTG